MLRPIEVVKATSHGEQTMTIDESDRMADVVAYVLDREYTMGMVTFIRSDHDDDEVTYGYWMVYLPGID